MHSGSTAQNENISIGPCCIILNRFCPYSNSAYVSRYLHFFVWKSIRRVRHQSVAQWTKDVKTVQYILWFAFFEIFALQSGGPLGIAPFEKLSKNVEFSIKRGKQCTFLLWILAHYVCHSYQKKPINFQKLLLLLNVKIPFDENEL